MISQMKFYYNAIIIFYSDKTLMWTDPRVVFLMNILELKQALQCDNGEVPHQSPFSNMALCVFVADAHAAERRPKEQVHRGA